MDLVVTMLMNVPPVSMSVQYITIVSISPDRTTVSAPWDIQVLPIAVWMLTNVTPASIDARTTTFATTPRAATHAIPKTNVPEEPTPAQRSV